MSTKAKAKAETVVEQIVLTNLAVWNITAIKSNGGVNSFVKMMEVDDNGDKLATSGMSFDRVFPNALIADAGIVPGTRLVVQGFKEVGKVQTSFKNDKGETVDAKFPSVKCVWTSPAISITNPFGAEMTQI